MGLYEEGMDVEASVYATKRRELEKMTNPIFLRLSEAKARPAVVKQASEAVNWTLTVLTTWESERPEVTSVEVAHVRGMCDNFSNWLDARLEKQAALQSYEPPAFLSHEVTAKLAPIEKEMRRLIKKPKPKPTKHNATNATNRTNRTTPPTPTSDAANESAVKDESENKLPSHDEL